MSVHYNKNKFSHQTKLKNQTNTHIHVRARLRKIMQHAHIHMQPNEPANHSQMCIGSQICEQCEREWCARVFVSAVLRQWNSLGLHKYKIISETFSEAINVAHCR